MIPWMEDPDYTIEGRHYAHPLISWPSVIAGTIAAISIGFLLNLVGLAIGASAFNPFELDDDATGLTVGATLYAMFAQLVAFQIGAYIAARSQRFPDHFGGALTGFMVWALAVFVAALLATLAASAASSANSVAAGAAQAVSEFGDLTEGGSASREALGDAEDAADTLVGLAWVGVGALGLGLAGAIAGGWLGAAHPKWERRPRLEDRGYQSTTTGIVP